MENVQDLLPLLEQSLIYLLELGPEYAPRYKNIEALKERLLQERFHLAILGQFKRGKSTFLNALLGAELLPTAVIPLTAIPTFLLWGPEPRVSVLYEKGFREEASFLHVEDLTSYLVQFVTEAGNPHNQKGVSAVEVYYPSPLLKQGVVLIDTPGIGSTFQHNTETTLKFLPQCDAAVFLLSADPPLTQAELEFLQAVRSQIAHLFFILNKVDYLDTQEMSSLLHFVKKVLQEHAGIEEPLIFCASARQGLEARKSNNTSLWRLSGMEEISRYLLDFLARDKKKVLHEALAKKASDILADTLMRLNITLKSLKLPLSELDERLKLFEEKLKEAEQQKILVGDLLAGDRRRLIAFLEEQAENLRQKARVHLEGILQSCIAQAGDELEEGKIRETLAEAIPRFFDHELKEISRSMEARITEVLRPYEQRADELVEAIRKAAAELFNLPYYPPLTSDAFEKKNQPYWVTHKWDSSLSGLSEGLVFRLLPPRMRRAKLTKRLREQIESLVLHNVENLRWATLQNLEHAFRFFEARLNERLQSTISATHGAIQSARAKRQERAENLSQEMAVLQSSIKKLQEIRAKLL